MQFEAGAVRPIGSIEEGWNLIKSDYWLFFGMSVILILIAIVLSLSFDFVVTGISAFISAGLGLTIQNTGEAGRISATVIPQLISMILSIFTGLVEATLSGIFSCGIYTALIRKANGEYPEFSDLFAGFQYFQQCLIFSIILNLIYFAIGLIVLVIGAIFGVSAFSAGLFSGGNHIDPRIFGAIAGVIVIIAFVYIIFALIIGICTTFVYPLIVERKLSAFPALGLSAKAGLNNFFGLFGMFIMQGLMVLAGLALCGIGILFVIPILSASTFAAYQSVFGRNREPGQYMPPPPPIFGYQQNF